MKTPTFWPFKQPKINGDLRLDLTNGVGLVREVQGPIKPKIDDGRFHFRPWMFFNKVYNDFQVYQICGGKLSYERYCGFLHLKPISDWEDLRFARESKVVTDV